MTDRSPRSPQRPREGSGPTAGARALAQRHREALQRRARRIRRVIAGATAALFSAAFVLLYAQLASGHDPALTAAARKHSSAATSTNTSIESGSSSARSGETGGSSSAAPERSSGESGSTTSESPSALTTTQS